MEKIFFLFHPFLKKFNLGETKLLNQLKKNPFGFLDNKGLPHKVEHMAPIFLDILKIGKAKTPSEINQQMKCIRDMGGKNAKSAFCKLPS